LAWHARYEINWGHQVASRHGPVEVTRQEYNQQAGAQTPEQPTVPICGQHIWDWWWELNARRPPGFDSLAPLSYTEILSWIFLTGKALKYTDIGLLIEMDNAWINTIATERKDRSERDKEKANRNKGMA
jgi:hypothetical protein